MVLLASTPPVSEFACWYPSPDSPSRNFSAGPEISRTIEDESFVIGPRRARRVKRADPWRLMDACSALRTGSGNLVAHARSTMKAVNRFLRPSPRPRAWFTFNRFACAPDDASGPGPLSANHGTAADLNPRRNIRNSQGNGPTASSLWRPAALRQLGERTSERPLDGERTSGALSVGRKYPGMSNAEACGLPTRRHGHGPLDLPLDYRSPWWTAVGNRVRAAGGSLSVYDPCRLSRHP